jgi:hypothetical protein
VNVPRLAAGESGASARVVALLALAVFINYIDRGNLGTAAPLLRDELALSNTQLGLLLSAFFWGYASLLWLWPWLRTLPPSATHATLPMPEGPATLLLLRSRELWGACLGAFCGAYALYLVLTWLPVYLVKARGFSMAQMSPVAGIVYALAATSGVLTGWISDRWLAAGASSRFARPHCSSPLGDWRCASAFARGRVIWGHFLRWAAAASSWERR